ncbi:hypothetical protein BST42_14965 [Mycolicibacterium rhodesiae]|uniref:Uncharacterized protein n=1 Tax=Mycolicibacterium rhodesiae TaxID=36814 RepID=A0A1X0ITZ8_MYCRH|nr:hypothetical protein BST42_14965 [Mycolicibacterium rhodesiae]
MTMRPSRSVIFGTPLACAADEALLAVVCRVGAVNGLGLGSATPVTALAANRVADVFGRGELWAAGRVE